MAVQGDTDPARPAKTSAAFRSIGEVAKLLEIETHVIRFWETKFTQLKPMRRPDGRRYFRPEHVELLTEIRDMLHTEGLSIRGAQMRLKQRGASKPDAVTRQSRQGITDPAVSTITARVDGSSAGKAQSPSHSDLTEREQAIDEARSRLSVVLSRLEGLRERLC